MFYQLLCRILLYELRYTSAIYTLVETSLCFIGIRCNVYMYVSVLILYDLGCKFTILLRPVHTDVEVKVDFLLPSTFASVDETLVVIKLLTD